MKVIELDQRSGEKRSVGDYPDNEAGVKEAEAQVSTLDQKARNEGKDYLRYWLED